MAGDGGGRWGADSGPVPLMSHRLILDGGLVITWRFQGDVSVPSHHVVDGCLGQGHVGGGFFLLRLSAGGDVFGCRRGREVLIVSSRGGMLGLDLCCLRVYRGSITLGRRGVLLLGRGKKRAPDTARHLLYLSKHGVKALSIKSIQVVVFDSIGIATGNERDHSWIGLSLR